MAYGSAKGRIFRGDIYAEDDPNQDTYIDWGNDFISFGVGGVKVLNVSASNTLVQVLGHVSASGDITGSNFHAHGIISASSNITASGHVSASAFYGDGQYLKNVGGGSGDGIFTTLASGNAYTTSSLRVGSVGEPSASLHVSGTGAGAGPVFRLDSSVAGGTPLFFVSGSGRVGIGTATPGIGGSSDTKLDVQGHLTIGKSGTAYIFNNNDADTYIKLGGSVPPGTDGMQFFVGGKRMLMLDENGTDRVVIGNSSSDFTVVSGSLIVSGNLEACAGTASIAHLSGCSPITVHAPMSSSHNISASTLYVASSNASTSATVRKDHSDTTAATITGLEIDFDKTGASTSNNTMYGLNIDMDNATATNGTNYMYGLNVTPTLAHAANAGATFVYGANIVASGSTNGSSFVQGARIEAAGGDVNYGLQLDVEDGGVDLRIESSADNGDYFQIQTTTSGASTITTNDDGGASADLTFNIDGDIHLNPVGSISASSNITASGHVSASIFYGDGQYLKNLPGGGGISTTTGGGNNTLYLPFVSSSTGVGSATLFTDSAVALKPQSGSLILDGDGEVGVSGSVMGMFTTTSSYGSRLSLKGAEVGDVAGTEPYIQVVSSSYFIPADTFGPGQPPFPMPVNYETLEISAPNGHGKGSGNVRISGSGDLHLNFTNFSNSMGAPFTNTWGSSMEFGTLATYIYATSSKMVDAYGIFNGHDDGSGMPYAALQFKPDIDPGQWLFSHGENQSQGGMKFFRVEELTASFDNIFLQPNASASFEGYTEFFGGLEVHAVPLTSNVGAQIGGGSGNKLQVVVTSSFENIAMFGAPAIFNSEAYFNSTVSSNGSELMISGSAGGGMAVNITSSNNNNSLYTGGSALLGHSGGGNADIRLFAGGSGQAGTISGSNNLQIGGSAQVKGNVIAEGNLNTTGGNISGSGALMIGGNADIAGNTTLGTGPDNLTLNVNSIKSNAGDVTWLLRSGSVGTGSGPGKNGPLMFYITHSGGSTTDLLKFNTASGSVGVVFPRTFYPNSSNNVDMGTHDLAFRTVYATQFGSAGNVAIDGVNASGGNFTVEMPNGFDESFMIRDQTAGSNWMTFGTNAGSGYRVNISKPTYIGSDESAYPKITLDVHYTGSQSPVNLPNNTGGGEVVYFGTGSLVNVGGVHYLNSKGGWVPTNADATGSGLTGDGGHKQLLGIALGSSPSADGMLIRGFFNATGAVGYYMGDFQSGSAVYLQAQGAPGQGRMSGTAPTGSGRFVRVVGYATDTPHVIYFNPDSTYVELA